jgi:hypothetical protein
LLNVTCADAVAAHIAMMTTTSAITRPGLIRGPFFHQS